MKNVFRSYARKSLVALAACVAGGVLILLSARAAFVPENDPRLALAPFGYTLAAKPFSGIIYAFHHDGSLARLITVWKGKLHGKDYQWHRGGPLFVERSYRDGREHGVQKTWHANGVPHSYSVYYVGLRTGESWGWHDNAAVKAFAFHQDGEEIAIKSFSRANKPFHNYVRAGGAVHGIIGDRLCDRSEQLSR